MVDFSKMTDEELDAYIAKGDQAQPIDVTKMSDEELDKFIAQGEARSQENTIGGYVKDAADWVADVWTGEQRGAGTMTEVPLEFYRKHRGLPEKLSLQPNDVTKLQTWHDHLGQEAGPSGFDDHGNAWVTANGNKHFLNAPGASEQDAKDALPAVAMEVIPALKGAKWGKKMFDTGGRIIGAGLGAAVGKTAHEWIRARAGSTEPTDVMAIAVSGLFGLTGEAASVVVGKWLANRAANRAFFDPETGWTEKGRKAVENAGLDVDKLTTDMGNQFRALAEQSKNVDDLSARIRLQEATDYGAEPTRGQVTRDRPTLSRENAMRYEAYGEPAQKIFRNIDKTNEAAVIDARDAMQRSISGADNVSPHRGSTMDDIQRGLSTARDTAREGVRTAYKEAGAYDTWLRPEMVSDTGRALRANIRSKGFDINGMPDLDRLLKELEGFNQGNSGPKYSRVNFKMMEDWRKRLNSAYGNLGHEAKSTKAAMDEVRHHFDDLIDDGIEDALLSNAPDAAGVVTAFKAARKLRHNFALKFENDKVIEKLIATEYIPDGTMEEGGEKVFMMVGEEAADSLLGKGKQLVPTGRVNSLRRIRDILGADSPQWRSFQEEAFLRLFKLPDDGTSPAQAMTQFKTTFQDLMVRKQAFMRGLFDDGQIRDLAKLHRVVRTLTDIEPGTLNYSGTAYAASQMLRKIFGPGGAAIEAFGRIVGRQFNASDEFYGSRARDLAANRLLPVQPKGPVGLGGGLGAGMGADVERRR